VWQTWCDPSTRFVRIASPHQNRELIYGFRLRRIGRGDEHLLQRRPSAGALDQWTECRIAENDAGHKQLHRLWLVGGSMATTLAHKRLCAVVMLVSTSSV
jgi:hypothetical protein